MKILSSILRVFSPSEVNIAVAKEIENEDPENVEEIIKNNEKSVITDIYTTISENHD